jgi:magnesium transporter
MSALSTDSDFMAHTMQPTSTPVEEEFSLEEEESHFDVFYDQPGTLPGTLDLDPDAPPPEMVLIEYNENRATRTLLSHPEECIPYIRSDAVTWLDVQGLGNTETWRKMSEIFQFHPIALEDVVNVPQRPKVVFYENPDHIIIVTLMVLLKPGTEEIHKEQVSIILGKNYLITVQEEPQYDCLQPVRDRIRANQGIIRKQGADYLAYSIVDAIVDGYFPVLEHYSDRLEELEDEVFFQPHRDTIATIYEIKQSLLSLRRAIWSQREAIHNLSRQRTTLIGKKARVYFRDCYDHTVNIRDMLETYRELSSDLVNIYLSTMGNRMNEIMKLLTVVSSIFIPLTFIAGVYGMNFDPSASPWNMPEIDWYWGYPACLGLMALTAIVLVTYFWRKGWFEDFSGLPKPTKEEKG